MMVDELRKLRDDLEADAGAADLPDRLLAVLHCLHQSNVDVEPLMILLDGLRTLAKTYPPSAAPGAADDAAIRRFLESKQTRALVYSRVQPLVEEVCRSLRRAEAELLVRAAPPDQSPDDRSTESRVRDLLLSSPSLSCRSIARTLGCSASRIRQTSAWKATMKVRPPRRSPKTVRLSDAVLRTNKVLDQELEKLIGEQTRDDQYGHRLQRR